MALTKITGGVIDTGTNLTAVGATFSGNVSIAGTLTYEDVTNIDSVGLITARSGIEFGTRPGLGASISDIGNAVFAGVVTATSYYGDGSNLTGIDATQIVTGNTSVQTVDTGSDGHVKFNTEGSERARIDNSGRLLIGTSSSAGFGNSRFQVNIDNYYAAHFYQYTNDQYGTEVHLGKSRGTLGNQGLVSSGDSLAQLRFFGSDGSGFRAAAEIAVQVDGTPGTNDMPGRLVFSTTADGASSPTERMRIDSSGRMGLGTAGPGRTLHALDSTAPQARFSGWYSGGAGANSGSIEIGSNTSFLGRIEYDPNGNTNLIFENTWNSTGAAISWITAGSERARIDGSGRLLVGTSSSRSVANVEWNQQIEGTSLTGASFVTNNASTAGSYLILGKTRGTSIGSNTIVQSGDSLGQIRFAGANGTNLSNVAAAIEGYVDGTPGVNDMPGRLVFATTADGASSPTERMRIGNNGLTSLITTVGCFDVGTTQGAGTSYWLFTGRYGSTAGSAFTGTASIIINSNGNVQNTNNSYGAISDIKLKENIVDANSQWDDLKALQVRNYNFKEGQTHTQIGLIAQEAELVSPGLVYESPDRDDDGNDLGTTTKSLNYSVLYMKAVKALQEAMERIEQLESEMAAVKSQLS